MNRRMFLSRTCAMTGGLLCGNLSNAADTGGTKTLVVVFQRGGCDGLNMIVPHADDDYYALRPTIAIARPGSALGALDLDGMFGLHPRLTGLVPLYDAGNLAVLPAVHYPDAERSHFAGQDLLETALGEPHSGWLGRYLGEATPSSPRALSLDSIIPLSLAGARNVLAFGATIDSDDLPASDNDSFISAMAEAYRQSTQHNAAMTRVHRSGRSLWPQIELLELLSNETTPAHGALYPDTIFGERMRRAAQAIKSRVGLELITINSTGWDTHSAQGGATGRQGDALADLGDSVASFWRDLGADGEDVVLLCMTEFGRTAAENGSAGTDHGNASAWLACGPPVRGGVFSGPTGWPGLAIDALHEGRDLSHTIDFRDVMAEVLRSHLAVANTTSIFPGHASQTVGFL